MRKLIIEYHIFFWNDFLISQYILVMHWTFEVFKLRFGINVLIKQINAIFANLKIFVQQIVYVFLCFQKMIILNAMLA